ncbi:arsenate reductase (glutaredoxin) [Jannaschia sp. EhC01]|uniref:Arsenate reductase n=1 Tax=Gymnodinialimonas phycosphaerae TaxID=2841589 RepID=A0A975TXS0_9RHOB|nr:arsenate reductase (glutaredoxin) [Gymnodinialimonas phycosphaerae]MBY4892807.1 arsenate reductase (glutaredoxin) [Gymnodinialimonas phycosphaerae]OAN75334.1 arsenate reductase (glutaredoxin) [Jannaschia sp. EhC01]
MDLTLWHNPRCSKSRAALALLEDAGHAPGVRLYLQNPPTEAEIEDLLAKMDVAPRALMRRGEKLYKDLGLADADDAALIVAMATHPILIERPILITPKAAAIGRPPEALLPLL